LHEEELHEEHPEPDEETCFSTPLIPKSENFFLIFFELHEGHEISGSAPETSFSNSLLHLWQVYSNIGIVSK
jgi:hypothetical protein